jgi:hemolysin III
MYHGEKLNSITHLAGTALSLVGLGALLTVAIQHRDPWMIASFTIFGLTLVLLYSMSTLYHSFSPPRLKKIFQKLDHVSIYLLIAGSYTPYTLVTLRDGKGPMMLAVVWSLAIIGIALDVFSKRRIEVLQVIIYLAMGWVCVLDFSSLKAALPLPGIIWLIAGGLAYTLGIIFYALDSSDKIKHSHGIWHLFVLAGSICHFISIIGYVR